MMGGEPGIEYVALILAGLAGGYIGTDVARTVGSAIIGGAVAATIFAVIAAGLPVPEHVPYSGGAGAFIAIAWLERGVSR